MRYRSRQREREVFEAYCSAWDYYYHVVQPALPELSRRKMSPKTDIYRRMVRREKLAFEKLQLEFAEWRAYGAPWIPPEARQ